jgi:hypothetical protein
MTPKFKYDPEQHCLREQPNPNMPRPNSLTVYGSIIHESWNNHLASLHSIRCAFKTVWNEGELSDGVHFCIRPDGLAFPLTAQPRLYTQAEALEIWRAGYDCGHAEAAREDYIDKEQFFKTRFNVEL